MADAPEDEFERAEEFCVDNPPNAPRFLTSADVDRIRELGANAWSMKHLPPICDADIGRFKGYIKDVHSSGSAKGGPKVVEVVTEEGCGDSCVVSNYPLAAGMYDIRGKEGVYYEVTIEEMLGVVAVGELPCISRGIGGLTLVLFSDFVRRPRVSTIPFFPVPRMEPPKRRSSSRRHAKVFRRSNGWPSIFPIFDPFISAAGRHDRLWIRLRDRDGVLYL